MHTSKITLRTLQRMKTSGEKIACLTAYDASFSRLLEIAGVEVVLVGDSLGMVIQGRDNTLGVSVQDMIYHCQNVRRGCQRPFLIVDMPFMSDHSKAQALGSASRLLAEGGAEMVKLEGDAKMAEVVQEIARRGIPVCAHLGLLPQSVHKMGGYRRQGTTPNDAERIYRDALKLEQAGADIVLLESVPGDLAKKISAAIHVPVIGIGAGSDCDGQVLVLYDMLGIGAQQPSHSRNFLAGEEGISEALQSYVRAVKQGAFPAS